MRSEPWRLWELELLKEKYETMTVEQIQKEFLPHRTVNAIRITLTRHKMSQALPKQKHINEPKNTGLPWTRDEIAILKKHFADMPTRKLQQAYLQSRSLKAIERRAARMGIVRTNRRPTNSGNRPYAKRKNYARWSEQELELLRKHRNRLSPKELHEKYLPGKSVPQIWTKLRNESAKEYVDRTWTDEEVKILTENAGKIPTNTIVELLPARTKVAVQTKAGALGLKLGMERHPSDWTDAETRALIDHHGTMSVQEIQSKYLPGRTLSSCKNKITKLRKSGSLPKTNKNGNH